MLLAAPRVAAFAKARFDSKRLRVNTKQSNIQSCSDALREGTRDKRDLPVRRFARMEPNSRALRRARFIDEMPAPPLPF